MDLLPKARRRAAVWIALFTATIVVTGAGISVAAVRYESRREGNLLPDTSIGGVDLGGASFEAARARLSAAFEVPLDVPVRVEAGGKSFVVTARQLGARTNALQRLGETIRLQTSTPLHRRLWHRLTRSPLTGSMSVVRTLPSGAAVEAFLEKVSREVDRPPQDADVEVTGGGVRVIPESPGYSLDADKSLARLRHALLGGRVRVRLAGREIQPEMREANIEDILVIVLAQGRLYHYENEALVNSYQIVSGGPLYPTSPGEYYISAKRVNPVWHNPAKYPGGWGQYLPSVIYPGWGNPLGTRAMNLSDIVSKRDSLMRVHGTYKSLGANESRGCIRMRIPESEELFERVEVGARVVIV